MRRLASIPGITFLLFFVWKVGLLLFTSQPVPANDAFFYDGPVVNYLLHGKYCNPSLAAVLPISATEVFSAYPPLHQFALLGWMKVAGTSALAAMWFHVLLLGVFAVTIFAILRELRAPPFALNWAGMFLFAITFHDRPDTLAQVFGALAVWALVRGWNGSNQIWAWLSALFLFLAFGTSLQIGGICSIFLALLSFGAAALHRIKFPLWPAIAFVVVLGGVIALVQFGYPRLWAGFREHVAITPSVTGWRSPRVGELLKIGRAAAGTFLVMGLLGWLFATGRLRLADLRATSPILVALCGVLTSLALIIGCLVILTPNTIHIANYFQPLIIGTFLTGLSQSQSKFKPNRPVTAAFIAALLLVSLRALGMTTWGVLCARDVSRAEAIAQVRTALDTLPANCNVMVSSAYLYDVAQYTNVNWIHSDWPARPGRENAGIHNLRPTKFILTQFDYYRRFAQSFNELGAMSNGPQFKITDLAHMPPPDSFAPLQKILQHVAWAPIIVDVTWPEPSNTNHENTTPGIK